MNVTFHALTAVGIAHIAAIRLESLREGWFYRSDVWVLGSAFTLGVLSHAKREDAIHVDSCRGGSPAPRCADLAEASSWRTSADSGRAMNNQSAPKKTP